MISGMGRERTSWGSVVRLLAAVLGSVAILGASFVGCGQAAPGDSTTGPGLSGTTSSGLNETTVSSPPITLPVSIPPELSRYASLVGRLQAQEVAVVALRDLSDPEYGSGVEVVLRSQSGVQKGTPQDIIGGALVFRAAILEKMAGTDIDAVGVAYQKPSGEIERSFVEPIDRTIEASWYAAPGLTLEEVSERVTQAISASFASGPFQVMEVRATLDPDGTRVLWVKLAVSSVAVANDHINEPADAVGGIVDSLNTNGQAKIGVIRSMIDTTAGEPVKWILTDLQLQSSTSWNADGITNETWVSPATTN
jgi:hypothetical protein